MAQSDGVFCEEPWNGLFSINSDGTVVLCPCYAKVPIGNLREATLQEIWNAPTILEIRQSFSDGVIPPPCQDQLCPVVVNAKTRVGYSHR